MVLSEREISSNYNFCSLSVLPAVLISFFLCVTGNWGTWSITSCLCWRAAEIGVFLETRFPQCNCSNWVIKHMHIKTPTDEFLDSTNKHFTAWGRRKGQECTAQKFNNCKHRGFTSESVLWGKMWKGWIFSLSFLGWKDLRSEGLYFSCLTWSHHRWNYLFSSGENWWPSLGILQELSPGSQLPTGSVRGAHAAQPSMVERSLALQTSPGLQKFIPRKKTDVGRQLGGPSWL